MKNIYNLDLYFNSIKHHIYYFDVLIKKSSITKDALLRDLDIAYMTYKRAKESDSNAGYKLVSKLDDYFNINTIDYSKKEEYENTLNLLLNRFYYRSDSINELEPILLKYIEENNFLKPLFLLMHLLLKLVNVKDPKKTLDENKEIFSELKLYTKNFFVSPFIEMFTIVEILYNGDKLYEIDFNKNTSENMKGMLYNGCAANAFISKKYSLCLYYCTECRNYLVKDYNFNRLVFINLMYFACLNANGEYNKCFNESRLQLTYLCETGNNQELIKATKIHYFTACLGLGDYFEVINSINENKKFSGNDYVFILLASYKYDKKIYQRILTKYMGEKDLFSKKQNEHIQLILDFLNPLNKSFNKEEIIKSELNIGLKEILLKKY